MELQPPPAVHRPLADSRSYCTATPLIPVPPLCQCFVQLGGTQRRNAELQEALRDRDALVERLRGTIRELQVGSGHCLGSCRCGTGNTRELLLRGTVRKLQVRWGAY